jgi:Na+-translocating ferredoxin:NAD+ oxidoreductase RnfC subunit
MSHPIEQSWMELARKRGPIQYSDEILRIAQGWEVYADELTDSDGKTWPCIRCRECTNAIVVDLPEAEPGIIAYHLMNAHGYRMDGRNERDQETAARAAAERGEMNAYRS